MTDEPTIPAFTINVGIRRNGLLLMCEQEVAYAILNEQGREWIETIRNAMLEAGKDAAVAGMASLATMFDELTKEDDVEFFKEGDVISDE